jgi:hypothetical protein
VQIKLSTTSKNRILIFHFNQAIIGKPNYRMGLLMIPFAIRIIHVTGTLTPAKIPVKNKASLLSIIYQKLDLVRV